MHEVEPELQAATIAVLRERGWDGLTLERVAEVAGPRALDALAPGTDPRGADRRARRRARRRTSAPRCIPILTAAGTGRERLERGLEALCALLDRHLPLLLATDEAFHQAPAPGQPPDYLQPVHHLPPRRRRRRLARRRPTTWSRRPTSLFNAVAWPYVHLRGRHDWPADRARRVVGSS